MDVDLLLTGAILHDIGKIDELTFDRGFGYSTEGQLIGHIVMGVRMIGDEAARDYRISRRSCGPCWST